MGDYDQDLDESISNGFGIASGLPGGSLYDSVNGWGDAGAFAGFACSALQTGASIGSAASGGFGAPIGIGVSVITNAVTNGMAAHDSQKVVAGLRQILQDAALQNAQAGEAAELKNIIMYCLQKRTSRRDRQISGAFSLGAGVGAFQNVKGIYKAAAGTKGVNRHNNANKLFDLAKSSSAVGKLAQQVVALICGGSFDDLLRNAIKNGMKSSL